MIMRLRSLLLACCAVPLLTACINDGASFEIEKNSEHVISVIREQPYPWDNKVDFYVVVSRMPFCMRRHSAGTGTQNSKVEIYQVPSGAYIVKLGKRMFATETQNCVNFAKMDAEPDEGMGTLMGTFLDKSGKLVFEPAKVDAPEAK
jgi:hypothetical protein